jgi:hypothetical protein
MAAEGHQRARAMSEAVHAGGCHCGAVRYEFRGEPSWSGHCHCSMCRRASGAPFVTWLAVPTAAFRFTRGGVKSYASSDRALRGFCAECGTPLTFVYHHRPEALGLTATSLDDAAWLKPGAHIFWNDRLPWLRFADGLPTRP